MRYIAGMAKTVPFSMRLPPDLKEALQKRAAAERRSLTNYIETLLWAAEEDAARWEKESKCFIEPLRRNVATAAVDDDSWTE